MLPLYIHNHLLLCAWWLSTYRGVAALRFFYCDIFFITGGLATLRAVKFNFSK